MLKYLKNKFLYKIKYKGLKLHPSAQFHGSGIFQYGINCKIAENNLFIINGKLTLGSDIDILHDCEFDADEIEIGNNTSVQKNSTILGRVKIGSYNVLGPNLYISSNTHNFRVKSELNIRDQDELNLLDDPPKHSILIGEDCWFGINVVVMPGIHIGKGCIIGANSVVTQDIAPYCVVAGCPAKIISKRLAFDPPKEIKPCDEHLPYFYEGLKTRTLERRDGLIALSRPDFGICLDTKNSTKIKFEITGAKHIHSMNLDFRANQGIVEIPMESIRLEGISMRFSCGQDDWLNARIKRIWAE